MGEDIVDVHGKITSYKKSIGAAAFVRHRRYVERLSLTH